VAEAEGAEMTDQTRLTPDERALVMAALKAGLKVLNSVERREMCMLHLVALMMTQLVIDIRKTGGKDDLTIADTCDVARYWLTLHDQFEAMDHPAGTA
jgi:hypothetical protein